MAATAGQTRSRTATSAVLLALLLVAVRFTLAAGPPNEARWRLLALIGVCWVVFAAGAAALLRTPARTAVPLLVVGAVALQVLAVQVPPRMTDDYYRYAWDGRVQAAGIDPYRFAPVDPATASLRDDWLFPPSAPPCATDVRACTRLNHPTSPTIYPPVAQAAFWLLHVVTAPLGPDGGGALALQVAAALVALATTGALLLVLRRTGGDPRRAVLWAWCPTVVLEAGNNAHVDVVAALLVVVALGGAARGHPVRAGLAVGAAVATKLLPVLLLPALLAGAWRRWRPAAAMLAAAAVVVVAGYLPHVVAVGPRVLGFLPGYLDEEGYGGGRGRFARLGPWLPDAVAALVALALVAGTAVAVARRGDPARPWAGATVLVGVAFAIGGVTYPWYALLLVALVALGGRAEWLALAVAAYPGYFAAALPVSYVAAQRVGYGAALAVVLAVTLWRPSHPVVIMDFGRVARLKSMITGRSGAPASPASRPGTTPGAPAATAIPAPPAARPPR